MLDEAREIWEIPAVRAATIFIGSIIGAKLVALIIHYTIVALTRRTKTTLDDQVVEVLRRPIFMTCMLVGVSFAVAELPITEAQDAVMDTVLLTVGILWWASAGFRVTILLLEALSRRTGGTSIIQPRTLPVFEMVIKLVVVGATIYFLFLAWRIDLTAWLASAGIVGIAVGFAAKDTLANLFAGIFIVADSPYKLGDFIVLDDGLRGQVTKIGIRSTRILTRDDIEITVPNAVIGASKIVNETGGRHVKQRIRISVEAAYGSDIDLVRETLLTCPGQVSLVSDDPPPTVRFREFAASGLRFELLCWLEDPAARGRALDGLNCAVYKAFARASIEIPYSKHDIYIKQMGPVMTSVPPS